MWLGVILTQIVYECTAIINKIVIQLKCYTLNSTARIAVNVSQPDNLFSSHGLAYTVFKDMFVSFCVLCNTLVNYG